MGFNKLHTYIKYVIRHYFNHDYDLVPHTTYIVNVNFLNEKLFIAIEYTVRVFAQNLLGDIRRRNIFFKIRFGHFINFILIKKKTIYTNKLAPVQIIT